MSERRIAGAGLDVFDVEPLPTDHPFRRMDNVVITPHLGYVTDQNYAVLYPDIVENIKAWRDGKPIRVITTNSESTAVDVKESGMVSPVELKLLSALAMREAYPELTPQFEEANGRKVAITWAGTVDIMKRMEAGECYDLVVASRGAIDDLVRRKKITPTSLFDVAASGIGVAVRRGAPRPDISSAESLKRAVFSAKTVGYSSGPSGVYLAGLFERMGIAGDIKTKLRSVPSGGTIGTIIASGEAEIGFQQISELVHAPGIDFLGPLPAEVQYITVITAGIPTNAKDTIAAQALAKFLAGPAAKGAMERAGLQAR